MATSPLYILLCSAEHEKIQMAAMMASIGAVSERAVEVFVSMNAVLVFGKDTPADKRYGGHRRPPRPHQGGQITIGRRWFDCRRDERVTSSE
jgi:peroxiredoxin family protein